MPRWRRPARRSPPLLVVCTVFCRRRRAAVFRTIVLRCCVAVAAAAAANKRERADKLTPSASGSAAIAGPAGCRCRRPCMCSQVLDGLPFFPKLGGDCIFNKFCDIHILKLARDINEDVLRRKSHLASLAAMPSTRLLRGHGHRRASERVGLSLRPNPSSWLKVQAAAEHAFPSPACACLPYFSLSLSLPLNASGWRCSTVGANKKTSLVISRAS